jgi:hypothetical protein
MRKIVTVELETFSFFSFMKFIVVFGPILLCLLFFRKFILVFLFGHTRYDTVLYSYLGFRSAVLRLNQDIRVWSLTPSSLETIIVVILA